ncbi:MAG: hypothetical protein JNL60_16170 [Bacteroidia bacterium]|nr:hypothetical protein [Bacteroidia bacterium]
MKHTYPFLFVLAFTAFFGNSLFAQDEDADDEHKVYKKSKFLTGVFIGAYQANQYTAPAYNGFGYDLDGNQNSFERSLMNQKINYEYSGKYGTTDQIAQALGVDPGQWNFDASDMPTNMRYAPAIMLGLNFRLPLSKRSNITLNLNFSKLNINGAFTMTLIKPQNPNPAQNNNVQVFPIKGTEQRMLFQLGFQQIFGKLNKTNVFGEIGINGTLAKYNSNVININGLQIDLIYYQNQTLYPTVAGPARKPVGFGIGAYAALGINFDLNEKFNMQILYSPSHERVKVGNNPTLKLQHAGGLRLYYKI